MLYPFSLLSGDDQHRNPNINTVSDLRLIKGMRVGAFEATIDNAKIKPESDKKIKRSNLSLIKREEETENDLRRHETKGACQKKNTGFFGSFSHTGG